MIYIKYIGYISILIGCYFLITSMAGFIKFKDKFRMLHISGLCDLLAAVLIIFGCGLIFLSHGNVSVFFKILFIVTCIYIISPITTNAISESERNINKNDNKCNIG